MSARKGRVHIPDVQYYNDNVHSIHTTYISERMVIINIIIITARDNIIIIYFKINRSVRGPRERRCRSCLWHRCST